ISLSHSKTRLVILLLFRNPRGLRVGFLTDTSNAKCEKRPKLLGIELPKSGIQSVSTVLQRLQESGVVIRPTTETEVCGKTVTPPLPTPTGNAWPAVPAKVFSNIDKTVPPNVSISEPVRFDGRNERAREGRNEEMSSNAGTPSRECPVLTEDVPTEIKAIET